MSIRREGGSGRSPRVALLGVGPCCWVLIGGVVHRRLWLLSVDVHALRNLLVLNALRKLVGLSRHGASGHWNTEGGLTGLVSYWLTLVVVSRGDGSGGFPTATGIVELVSRHAVVGRENVLLREVGGRGRRARGGGGCPAVVGRARAWRWRRGGVTVAGLGPGVPLGDGSVHGSGHLRTGGREDGLDPDTAVGEAAGIKSSEIIDGTPEEAIGLLKTEELDTAFFTLGDALL